MRRLIANGLSVAVVVLLLVPAAGLAKPAKALS